MWICGVVCVCVNVCVRGVFVGSDLRSGISAWFNVGVDVCMHGVLLVRI